MAVLILAKHDNRALNEATSKTVTAAKAIGGDITVLVAGQDCAAVAEAAAKLDGVRRVIHVEGEGYGHRLAEPLTELVRGMADGYEHILFPSTTSGKNVAPRLTVVRTAEPATRKAGVKVASVDELIQKLKTEEPATRKAGVRVGSVDELIAKLKDEAGVL